MYPALSITKPVPVDPLAPDLDDIDTTEGITRLAISATDPGGLSIADETEESFIECPKRDPEEDAPKTPPIRPAITARITAFPRVTLEVLFCCEDGIHHGPEECIWLI
jgi:hypothetical protein